MQRALSNQSHDTSICSLLCDWRFLQVAERHSVVRSAVPFRVGDYFLYWSNFQLNVDSNAG